MSAKCSAFLIVTTSNEELIKLTFPSETSTMDGANQFAVSGRGEMAT